MSRIHPVTDTFTYADDISPDPGSSTYIPEVTDTSINQLDGNKPIAASNEEDIEVKRKKKKKQRKKGKELESMTDEQNPQSSITNFFTLHADDNNTDPASSTYVPDDTDKKGPIIAWEQNDSEPNPSNCNTASNEDDLEVKRKKKKKPPGSSTQYVDENNPVPGPIAEVSTVAAPGSSMQYVDETNPVPDPNAGVATVAGETRVSNEREKQRIPVWDVFTMTDFHDKPFCIGFVDTILKAVKLAAYVVLFIAVVLGVIAARGSLQILETQLYNELAQSSNERTLKQDAISWLLLLIITIPDISKVLQCAFQYIFGKRNSPKFGNFIWIQIREVLHVTGLCGLLFKVMPYLGPVEVSAVLAVISAIPITLVIITNIMTNVTREHKLRLPAILLVGGMVAVCIMYTGKAKQSYENTELTVWLVISCVTVSLRWIDAYIVNRRKMLQFLSASKEGVCLTHLFSSSLRIVFAVVLFSQYFCNGIREPEETFRQLVSLAKDSTTTTAEALVDIVQPWDVLSPFFVHIFTAVAVYHCAVVSCRLCMQRVCFAVPLSIASPIYVTVVLATGETEVNWVKTMLYGARISKYSIYISFAVFLVAWVLQLLVCTQIWTEPHDRLSFVNRIFHLPQYCSPILDLSLLHSRKRPSISENNQQTIEETEVTSKVFIAATMWHESKTEMKQILTSLFRLDLDQYARSIARDRSLNSDTFPSTRSSNQDPDYYEFEGHIPFDDAMTTENDRRVPNGFVKQLMEAIEEAGCAVHKRELELDNPVRKETPYGERLEWTLPGRNKLFVHLKDKTKIRHKKRWSQIMYMYYGIGYRLMETYRQDLREENFENILNNESVFDGLPDTIKTKAKNTYFMALDGDVDFEPNALRLLIDKMKQDENIGATCGRIKPLGSGPIVWYQRFEYAIGHWLQKSAEHVFGCVLCSPGCFSLFRAHALMDDNIMRTYAKLPKNPKEYLQYDQGEDRWLCTLLLQQGYRIEYCAAAEAWTYAPEDFKEFFNQRRRWLPSTMANILDLLGSHRRTTSKNPNLSYLYVFYTLILFISSVLGPSTVLLAMASSIHSVLKINIWLTYVLVYGPTLVFVFICLKFKTNNQLNAAIVLSVLYALAMMTVIVGIFANLAHDGWYSPTAVFFYILVASFVLAGLLHIHEIGDLVFGLIYFIAIPAGYLFLVIYALCNLNNISWGTRETKTAEYKNKGEPEKQNITTLDKLQNVKDRLLKKVTEQAETEESKIESQTMSFLSIFRWAKRFVLLRTISSIQDVWNKENNNKRESKGKATKDTKREQPDTKHQVQSLISTNWEIIDNMEKQFWKDLIARYLEPYEKIEKPKEKQKAEEDLSEFRDSIAFAFFFVNGLWIIIMTGMDQVKSTLSITIYNDVSIEPLGFIFLVIFAILLVLQIVGMVVHRYGTLLHVIAATELKPQNDPEEVIANIRENTLIAARENNRKRMKQRVRTLIHANRLNPNNSNPNNNSNNNV